VKVGRRLFFVARLHHEEATVGRNVVVEHVANERALKQHHRLSGREVAGRVDADGEYTWTATIEELATIVAPDRLAAMPGIFGIFRISKLLNPKDDRETESLSLRHSKRLSKTPIRSK
jgi:hypothetical protein